MFTLMTGTPTEPGTTKPVTTLECDKAKNDQAWYDL
jgi:hypothetical protein